MMRQSVEWALVTGASGGLGAELARGLAAEGYRVVITARSAPALEAVANDIRQTFKVEVVVEALDLSVAGAATVLRDRLDQGGIDPKIVVNNAGFGISGEFVANDADRLRELLQLNIVSLTELSHIYGRRMAARGQGRILLVASMAAYQPDPLLAAYGASKAYVLSLGEALNVELGPKVSVTVLSPGLMDTGFNAASGYETPQSLRSMILPPAQVAEIGLRALFAGKPSVIAGRLNNIMALSARILPRTVSARATYRLSSAHVNANG
jgi:short-subunit dehydrogenase